MREDELKEHKSVEERLEARLKKMKKKYYGKNAYKKKSVDEVIEKMKNRK